MELEQDWANRLQSPGSLTAVFTEGLQSLSRMAVHNRQNPERLIVKELVRHEVRKRCSMALLPDLSRM
jgi:hypothetical protein